MSIWGDTYDTVKNRFTDWVLGESDSIGAGDEDSLTLDTINRAQDELWRYRRWDDLIASSELTLDSNRDASLPSDFGSVMRVYHDSDSDGRPDFDYYENSDHATGYTIRSNFTKAAGHSWTMHFYRSPAHTPVLLYQKKIDDFVGTGTEYSFFPAELLLRKAQMLFNGDNGDEDVGIEKAYLTALRDYEQKHYQQNLNQKFVQNDIRGVALNLESYALSGDSDAFSNTFDNSRDCR